MAAGRTGGALAIAATLALCTGCALYAGQASKDVPALASVFPKPDRPVAPIVSPIWHSETERDAASEVEKVSELLGIKPGMTVADIGAGSGFYAVRLSRLVGETGRVVAEDITPSYLTLLERKIGDLHLNNVTIVHGKPDDPNLPPRSTDIAILVHMYHEIEQPYALLYNLAPALKTGAKVGIVDALRSIPEHGTPPELLRCELQVMGYRETGFHTLTGSPAYLAIFELPAGQQPTAPNQVSPCKG